MNIPFISNLIFQPPNTPKDYLWALGAFAVTFIAFYLFKITILRKLGKWTDRTTSRFDDEVIAGVENIGILFYLFVSLYVALQFIKLPGLAERLIQNATLIVVVYYITKVISRIIEHGIKALAKVQNQDEEGSIIEVLIKFSKGVLWIIAFLLVLSNLGYNISSLLTGVGISGIAIAFALRSILEDLFSAFSIYFDKPFQPGDFIVVGEDRGTVQSIGLKSTRLITLQGEELIISNKELTKARVHNYKKMEKRRRTFEFGVTYDTNTKTLNKIPDFVEEIIKDVDLAEFDRAHFTEFGSSSLKFEAVYYVESPEFEKALSVQQEINLALHKKFSEEGIETAFPTRTVHLEQ